MRISAHKWCLLRAIQIFLTLNFISLESWEGSSTVFKRNSRWQVLPRGKWFSRSRQIRQIGVCLAAVARVQNWVRQLRQRTRTDLFGAQGKQRQQQDYWARPPVGPAGRVGINKEMPNSSPELLLELTTPKLTTWLTMTLKVKTCWVTGLNNSQAMEQLTAWFKSLSNRRDTWGFWACFWSF